MQCKSCNASHATAEPFVGKRISLEEKLQLGKGTPQRRITSMGRICCCGCLAYLFRSSFLFGCSAGCIEGSQRDTDGHARRPQGSSGGRTAMVCEPTRSAL